MRAAGILGVHDRRRRARGRSPAARGARRGSPTGCCAGCATSPRCAATARSTPPRPRAGSRVFGVDELGLDKVDRAILGALCEQFRGGPVGLSTLAIAVGEQPETVEDVYEPFLIQQGLIARTPRGRVAMPAAYEHLGLTPPAPIRGAPPSLVRLTAPAPFSLALGRRCRRGGSPSSTTTCPATASPRMPIEPRDAARLLVDRGPAAPAEHRHVADLPELLRPG